MMISSNFDEFISSSAISQAKVILANRVEDLICEICSRLVDVPTEIKCCGKLMCSQCYLSKNNLCECENNEGYEAMVSKRLVNKLKELTFSCPNGECEFQRKSLNAIKEHLDANNQETGCLYIKHQCEYCFQAIMRIDIQNHSISCTKRKFSCKYKRWSGCTFEGNNAEIKNHENDFEKHHCLALDFIAELKEQHRSRTELLENGNSNLKQQAANLMRETKELRDVIKSLKIQHIEIRTEWEEKLKQKHTANTNPYSELFSSLRPK